jgi:nucleotide-binding universal stress UspA family protein
MKKILVPTDFSDNAYTALIYAYRFASKRKLDIDLVHFTMPQAETSDFPTLSGEASLKKLELVKDILNSLKETIISKVAPDKTYKPNIEVHSLLDFPVHGAHRFATEHEDDIIICGSRGENIGITDRLLGTVSAGLINHAKIPVLFVPSAFQYSGIDHIAFATELKHSDPFELWRALQIFLPDVPVTRCVHITSKIENGNEKKKAELEKYLFDHNDSLQIFFHDIESDDMETALQKLTDRFEFDVLVMVKHKMNFFERLLTTSHTREMLKKVNIPLLVMHSS